MYYTKFCGNLQTTMLLELLWWQLNWGFLELFILGVLKNDNISLHQIFFFMYIYLEGLLLLQLRPAEKIHPSIEKAAN